MITDEDIRRITQLITSYKEVKKFILFGSYATKTMNPESDIDILVLVNDSVPKIRELTQLLYQKIYSVVNTPCDIIVEHESTFLQRSLLHTIERTIAREGKTLYAA